jgi:AraC-like DNA-binding protein
MGAPGFEIAMSAGISTAELADRDGRLPLEKLFEVFNEIERRTGDQAFGLHFAEAIFAVPDHPLLFAVQSSPTLGEAFRRAARYTRIIIDAAEIEINTASELVHLRFRVDHEGPSHPIGAQAALALLCLLGRQSLGARFQVTHVRFSRAAPDDRALKEYARIFDTQVTFGELVDELVAPRAVLAEPLPKADAALCTQLDRYLDAQLERTKPADLRARAWRLLGDDLSGGPPDIEWLAERLRMSPRSLQRRLRDAGTSFQELLDARRRDLAMQYLEQGLALAEVAFLVGFTDPSNFHRAFKRWTGMTPAEARRLRRGAPDLRP